MPRGTSLYDEARLQRWLWHPLLDPIRPVAFWDPHLEASFQSDGSGAITWTDRVGGIVATSPSGSRPIRSATIRNGRPGVNFTNGASFSFTPPSTFPSGTQVGSIVLGGSLRSTTGTGRWAFVYGSANSNSGLSRYITHSDQYASAGMGFCVAGVSGDNLVTAEMWTGRDRLVISQFGAPQAGQSAQTVYANVDGLATESGTVGPTVNTGVSAGGIGKWAYYGDVWDGVIGPILVYPPGLILPPPLIEKITAWDSYGSNKGGLDLPLWNRFRNRPPLIGD